MCMRTDGPRASRPQDPGITHTPRGWHSRGYLPHFDSTGEVQSITFRLFDAVPVKLVDQWKREIAWRQHLPPGDPKIAALCERIAAYEDAGYGSCFLRNPQVAEMVENALLYFDGMRYRLIRWSVMPNHVHSLLETLPEFPLGSVVHSWKSFAAKQANRILCRKGEFWMPDYHDRYIRDEDHFINTIEYIDQNPVKAGLVAHASQWRFSSAARRGI
jgi:REP element-mobilizing transposase RayT